MIFKRYSDFANLHQKLVKLFGAKMLPKFPPKIFFGNLKRENIDRRLQDLQKYLDGILSRVETFVSFSNF